MINFCIKTAPYFRGSKQQHDLTVILQFGQGSAGNSFFFFFSTYTISWGWEIHIQDGTLKWLESQSRQLAGCSAKMSAGCLCSYLCGPFHVAPQLPHSMATAFEGRRSRTSQSSSRLSPERSKMVFCHILLEKSSPIHGLDSRE